MNLHVDFGLHFLSNWAVRVLRLVEGQCVAIGGALGVLCYSCFERSMVSTMGIGQTDDKGQPKVC